MTIRIGVHYMTAIDRHSAHGNPRLLSMIEIGNG